MHLNSPHNIIYIHIYICIVFNLIVRIWGSKVTRGSCKAARQHAPVTPHLSAKPPGHMNLPSLSHDEGEITRRFQKPTPTLSLVVWSKPSSPTNKTLVTSVSHLYNWLYYTLGGWSKFLSSGKCLFARIKITFANPMFNFRELSRRIILHIYTNSGYIWGLYTSTVDNVNIQYGSLVVAGDLHQVGEVKNIVRHTWEHMKRPLGEATRLSRILSRTFAKLSQKPVIVLDKLKRLPLYGKQTDKGPIAYTCNIIYWSWTFAKIKITFANPMFNFRDLSPDWYLVTQMAVLYKTPFMDL